MNACENSNMPTTIAMKIGNTNAISVAAAPRRPRRTSRSRPASPKRQGRLAAKTSKARRSSSFIIAQLVFMNWFADFS
jgi:hypothetical protein